MESYLVPQQSEKNDDGVHFILYDMTKVATEKVGAVDEKGDGVRRSTTEVSSLLPPVGAGGITVIAKQSANSEIEEPCVQFLTVKTKTDDGGTNTEERNQRIDFFSKYSDDTNRMKVLMGTIKNRRERLNEDGPQEEGEEDVNDEEAHDFNQDQERKTRLSFELHPKAFV